MIHRGLDATYTGTFSEDGIQLIGGWRPDAGSKNMDPSSDDATMFRVT